MASIEEILKLIESLLVISPKGIKIIAGGKCASTPPPE
jgi:hypothetical protein